MGRKSVPPEMSSTPKPSRPTVTDPTASTPTGTISVYNPNLKPYVVYNYDLSAEYYLNPAGLFTVSVYHKTFNNYIVNFSQQATPALLAQYGAPTPPAVSAGTASLAQYNVLRILRGAGEEGLPTLAIRDRMIDEGSTVTRLLDKLEKASLVTRDRTTRFEFCDEDYSLSVTLTSSSASKACCRATKSSPGLSASRIFCSSLSCSSE